VPRKGRLLELTIQAIERLLASANVQIQSPGLIPDRDTGRQREIDVVISGKIGSSEVLGIVECRDRQGRQDVRWIEEIESKRASVRANFAIAVSSSGFTTGATQKAKALGISLRTLENLALEDFSNWFDCQDYRSVNEQFDNLQVRLISSENLPPEELPDLSSLREEDPLMRIVETGEEITKASFGKSIRSTFASRFSMEKLRECPGYKEHLEVGETWQSPPFPTEVTLPPEVPIEFLNGVPISAIQLKFDHIILVTRMTHSILKKVSSVSSDDGSEDLGAVGMYSQPLGDNKVLRIWTQSDGGENQQLFLQVDDKDSESESSAAGKE